jgi:hypothetical protein
VTTPIEQVKARLQVQYHRPAGTPADYSGPWDCAKKIVQRNGMRFTAFSFLIHFADGG